MEVDAAIVSELREKVLQRLQEIGGNDVVHPDDLKRFETDDTWVWRFYKHCLEKMTLATSVAADALKWRKEFGVNDLSEESFPPEYYQVAAIYTHNRDRNGNTLLFMHIREHYKGRAPVQELKRFLVHWVEKVDRAENGNKVTILFDLIGAGLGNSDMDFLGFVFSLFKLYYPYFLADILILELPWVLTAFWKIFKSWVPKSAQGKFKFVTKKTILDYIEPDVLPTQLGGTEIFQYTYERNPEVVPNGDVSNAETEIPKKQVHFTPDSKDGHEKSPRHNSTKGDFIGKSIQISPSDELVFTGDLDKESPPVTLQIKNTSQHDILFKVKTTAPNKYRVRPSTGTVPKDTSIDINVNLLPGFPEISLTQDKFLVMVLPIDEPNGSCSTSEIWKSCSRDEVIEHKIRCSWVPHEENKQSNGLNKELSALGNKVNSLRADNVGLSKEIQRLHYLLWMILAFQVIVVIVLFQDFIFGGQIVSESSSHCERL